METAEKQNEITKTKGEQPKDEKYPELRPENSICPFCNQKTEFIFVHGHYQCAKCKNIVVTCCEE
jgi:tRNA(Ile2) C34 agmatinyltransferase TiaS